jgi:hypothetical protein
MPRNLVIPTAVLILLITGVAHGLRTNRWYAPPDLQAAGKRLESVPVVIGDWESTPESVDPRQLEVAEVTAHLARRYVKRSTGDEVHLLILCGCPGPVALHPPTLCYRGIGYHLQTDPESYPVENSAGAALGTLKTVCLVKDDPAAEPLRIFWAWSNGGAFCAPDNPRYMFSRSDYLYKVYVVRRLRQANGPLQGDPAAAFVRELLPILQKNLSVAP